MKEITKELYEQYKKSGILLRTNDGQSTVSPDQVISAIQGLEQGTNLGDLITNQAPNYSSSFVSGINLPIAWYNSEYAEAFPQKEVRPIGDRTIVGVLFDMDKIIVRGGCIWDADSNLRNLGNIPNLPEKSKATPENLFPQISVFSNVGSFSYDPPTSNNNNIYINPYFYPRTRSGTATTSAQINTFLGDMAKYKKAYYDQVVKFSDGYTCHFQQYIDENFNLGVETEIITEPKNNTVFYDKKFDVKDIACITFVTDAAKPLNTEAEYKAAAASFLKDATDQDSGWMTNKSDMTIDDLAITVILHTMLPNVPLDGSSAAGGSIGKELIEYHDKGYTEPLVASDFVNVCDLD